MLIKDYEAISYLLKYVVRRTRYDVVILEKGMKSPFFGDQRYVNKFWEEMCMQRGRGQRELAEKDITRERSV